MLEPIAKEVSIIHRRDKFRAHEHSVENLHNSKVNVLTPFVPAELVGEDRIEQLVLEEVKGDRKEIIEIDDLIVNYGFVSSLPIKTVKSRKFHRRQKHNGNEYRRLLCRRRYLHI